MLEGPGARLTFATSPKGTVPPPYKGDENLGCDRLRIAAIVPRIADAHAIALAALDCGRYRLGAKRHGDEILQVAHHEAGARKLRATGIDVEGKTADHPLGVPPGRAPHRPKDGLALT